MESRRIVLLTEGYLRGWLDLVDKTPHSAVRREVLLQATERRLLLENGQRRLDVLVGLAGRKLSPGGVQVVSRELDTCQEMALPYLAEKTKVASGHRAEELNDPGFWKKVLQEARQEQSAPTSGTP